MIYPNLVNDKLQVKFDLAIAEPIEMAVYNHNLAGQRLKVLTVNSGPTSGTYFGSYFLSVKNSGYQKKHTFNNCPINQFKN